MEATTVEDEWICMMQLTLQMPAGMGDQDEYDVASENAKRRIKGK